MTELSELASAIIIDRDGRICDIGWALSFLLGYYPDQLFHAAASTLIKSPVFNGRTVPELLKSPSTTPPEIAAIDLIDHNGATQQIKALTCQMDIDGNQYLICFCSLPKPKSGPMHSWRPKPSVAVQLLDEAGSMIGLFDLDGRIEYLNHLALATLGRDERSLYGQPLPGFLGTEIVEKVNKRIKEVGDSRQGQEHIDPVDWPEGRRWYLSAFVPVADRVGTITGVQIVAQDITKLKTTQERLQLSHSRLQVVIDALHASIAVLSSDGVITDVNAAWREMARRQGGVADAYLGWNYFDVCRDAIFRGDADAEAILDGLRALLAQRETVFEAEYPCRTPETELWFHMIATRIDDDAAAIVVAHYDITARKHAEQHAAMQRQRIVEISESLAAEIAYLDQDNRFKFVNARFAAGFASTPEELAGKTLADVFQSEAMDQSAKSLAAASSGKRVSYQCQIALASGRRRVVVVDLVPDADMSGRLSGCYMFLYDSAQSADMQNRLSYTELLLTGILENSPTAIAIFDPQLQLVTSNPSYREQLGQGENAGVAEFFPRLLDTKAANQLMRAARKIVSGELERHSATVAVTIADDAKRWFRINLTPLQDIAPDKSRLLAVCVDITDEVKREAKHRQTAEQLEQNRAELERKNTAMLEILRSLEDDRRLYRHEVCESIRSKLEPIQRQLREHATILPAQLLARLEDIVTKLSQDLLGHSFQALRARLSPREIQVCELIRQGKTSKQIAAELNLSVQTVNKHRQVIRRKLNIENSDLNLAGFLWKES